jgi:lipid-A-disaccharide synthase
MTDAARPLSIYLVAAEQSGDALGAALIGALRARYDGPLELAGVGGEAMSVAGVTSPFAIEDLSIVGFNAIPKRLPIILRRIRETADAIIDRNPDALVIIDSPDFTHRVARRVRRHAPAIPIIDYVSPSVWAWRPGRAPAMRAYVDHVLAILPFEPAALAKLGGPPCSYVGHPLIERMDDLRPNANEALRRRTDPPLVLLLPGSRQTEIRRLIGILGETIGRVAKIAGPMELVLPTLPHLVPAVHEASANWAVQPRIVVDAAEKWAAFRNARAALAASGTVTLELALAGIPTVAAYRVSRMEEMIFRLLRSRMTLSSAILANLVLGEKAIPEFLQGNCRPDRLADSLVPLLSDTPQRQSQVAAFAKLDRIMDVGGEPPSAKAAAIVLDLAQRSRG